ncbi:MAG: carbohydrate kinase [Deltaproteobacteria bacterium]|nr:carbohydrate kinase [Deltaproteobacteria bacterium]
MKHTIVGIGEILWDYFPDGKKVGGAPTNFAYHADRLGAKGVVVSKIGNDTAGREILKKLKKDSLTTDYLEKDPLYPTGLVRIKLSQDRDAEYEIENDVAWDNIRESDPLDELAHRADAVCFGTLAQRSVVSRKTIQSFVKRCHSTALKIFDLNLRGFFYSREVILESLALANVVKVSEAELRIVAYLLLLKGEDRDVLKELSERFNLKLLALTKGRSGSVLYAQGEISEHRPFPSKIIDTVGTGDSFAAALAVGMLSGGMTLGRLNRFANQVASLVCASRGGMPRLSFKEWNFLKGGLLKDLTKNTD